MNKDKRVIFRTDDETLKKLTWLSEQFGMSMSEVIRLLIREEYTWQTDETEDEDGSDLGDSGRTE